MNVMQQNKAKKRKERIKTLCTLDTNDINLADQFVANELNRTFSRSKCKINKKNNIILQLNHSSTSSVSKNKEIDLNRTCSKSKISIKKKHTNDERMKTDYSNISSKMQRKLRSIPKKIIYPLDEIYRFDSFEVIKKVKEDHKQKVQIVRNVTLLKNKIKFLMIRTTDLKKRQDFLK